MDILKEPYLENILNKLASTENVQRPTFHHAYSIEPGIGFLGYINAIKIKGSNKNVDVIVKSAATTVNIRNKLPIRGMYLQEIYFYEKIYPEFKKLQEEYKVSQPFNNLAHQYMTSSVDCQELLIFENVTKLNFNLYPAQAMNGEHMELIFKVYGKYHALSYALKDQNLELYKTFTSNLNNYFNDILVNAGYGKQIETMAKSLMNIFDLPEEEKISEAFERCVPELSEMCVAHNIDEYSVITHGDCWRNNLMFKYEDINSCRKPVDMKLLDFQLSREGSPVYDLSYMFYTCATKEIMDNLNHYLNIYHRSLSKHLRQLGSNPEKLFPYSVLLDHWKRYSSFGFSLSIIVLNLMVGDKSEMPDFVKGAEENVVLAEACDFTTSNEGEYRKRMKDIIIHVYERNLI